MHLYPCIIKLDNELYPRIFLSILICFSFCPKKHQYLTFEAAAFFQKKIPSNELDTTRTIAIVNTCQYTSIHLYCICSTHIPIHARHRHNQSPWTIDWSGGGGGCTRRHKMIIVICFLNRVCFPSCALCPHRDYTSDGYVWMNMRKKCCSDSNAMNYSCLNFCTSADFFIYLLLFGQKSKRILLFWPNRSRYIKKSAEVQKFKQE